MQIATHKRISSFRQLVLSNPADKTFFETHKAIFAILVGIMSISVLFSGEIFPPIGIELSPSCPLAPGFAGKRVGARGQVKEFVVMAASGPPKDSA